MGYDMYLVRPPQTPDEIAAEAALRAAVSDAVAARNDAADALKIVDDAAYVRWQRALFETGTRGAGGLCSNDGWWVTKEECIEALSVHDAWVKANGDALPTRTDDNGEEKGTVDWWPKWIEYLKQGAAGNGFTVW
jgi:hypothetical protein